MSKHQLITCERLQATRHPSVRNSRSARGLPQCLRRRLSKQHAVRNREAPKLPKAMFSHNLRNGCLGRIRMPERPPHQMHSAQGEIADWSHAQMPFAGGAKCSLCDADGGANFGKVEWPVGMGLQEIHEPGEYGVTTAVAVSLLQAVAFSEASHRDVSKLIL